jgi:hypothetical protein
LNAAGSSASTSTRAPTRASCALHQYREALPHLARGRHGEPEAQRHAGALAHPVAVRVAPAERVEGGGAHRGS